jgi:hypothetical protein
VQQPLVGLAQTINQVIQLPQGKLSLMAKVLVTFSTSFSDLELLHWTPKVMYVTMFSKRFQLWSILNQLKLLIGNNVPSTSMKDIFYKHVHSYKIICNDNKPPNGPIYQLRGHA